MPRRAPRHHQRWDEQEDEALETAVASIGMGKWQLVAEALDGTRSKAAVAARYAKLKAMEEEEQSAPFNWTQEKEEQLLAMSDASKTQGNGRVDLVFATRKLGGTSQQKSQVAKKLDQLRHKQKWEMKDRADDAMVANAKQAIAARRLPARAAAQKANSNFASALNGKGKNRATYSPVHSSDVSDGHDQPQQQDEPSSDDGIGPSSGKGKGKGKARAFSPELGFDGGDDLFGSGMGGSGGGGGPGPSSLGKRKRGGEAKDERRRMIVKKIATWADRLMANEAEEEIQVEDDVEEDEVIWNRA
ncbi:hypothetical protein JCM10207_006184 [Rhodosporidiobolus poonsookiae]